MYFLKSLFETADGAISTKDATDLLVKSYSHSDSENDSPMETANDHIEKWLYGNLLPTKSLYTAIDSLNSLKPPSEIDIQVQSIFRKSTPDINPELLFGDNRSGNGKITDDLKSHLHIYPKNSLYATHGNSNPLVSWFIILIVVNTTLDDFHANSQTINFLKESLPNQFQCHFIDQDTSEETLKNAATKYALTHSKPKIIENDPFVQNTQYLADSIKLDDIELDILRTLSLINHSDALENIVDWHLPDYSDFRAHSLLSVLTTYPPDLIEYKLRHSGRLIRSHLVRKKSKSRRGTPLYEVDRKLTHAIMQ